MSLSKRQFSQLIKIIEATQSLLQEAMQAPSHAASRKGANGATRTRRTGKDLAAFKKAIKAERKAGASVAALAAKYGVTPSYLYQLH